MYINYNGSEIIYGELISWQSSGNICGFLKTIEVDKVVFCFLAFAGVRSILALPYQSFLRCLYSKL